MTDEEVATERPSDGEPDTTLRDRVVGAAVGLLPRATEENAVRGYSTAVGAAFGGTVLSGGNPAVGAVLYGTVGLLGGDVINTVERVAHRDDDWRDRLRIGMGAAGGVVVGGAMSVVAGPVGAASAGILGYGIGHGVGAATAIGAEKTRDVVSGFRDPDWSWPFDASSGVERAGGPERGEGESLETRPEQERAGETTDRVIPDRDEVEGITSGTEETTEIRQE